MHARFPRIPTGFATLAPALAALPRAVIPFAAILLAALAPAAARADDGEPRLVLDPGGHLAAITQVLFTPDGRELVSVSHDRSARFWDVATGEPLRVARLPDGKGAEGRLTAAALSPGGEWLAVAASGRRADSESKILLLSPAGAIQRVIGGLPGDVHALAFTSDGQRLVAAGHDPAPRLVNVADGAILHKFEGHAGSVAAAAISPDGKWLATASRDKTARLWSLEKLTLEKTCEDHEGEVRAAVWRRDGQAIITGASDGKIRVFGLDGALLKTHGDFDGALIHALAASPTADEVVVTLAQPIFDRLLGAEAEAPLALTLDLEKGPRLRLGGQKASVDAAAVSPDGRWIATAGGPEHSLCLWRADKGELAQKLVGQARAHYAVGWGADGETLGWGDAREPLAPGAALPLDRSFQWSALRFGPAPDDSFRRAQAARGSTTLELKTAESVAILRSGKEVAAIEIGSRVAAFSLLRGDLAAIGAEDGLYLHDARAGDQVREFVGHAGTINSVAISPDGRYLATASEDMTLRVWDPYRDEPLVSLFVAGDDWVAWTPEGYYAASPRGERLFGWQIAAVGDQPTRFFPAERFRKSLYRPDVLRLVLQTGGVARALEVASSRAAAPRVEDVEEIASLLPPEVVISKPAEAKLRVTEAKFELEASATARGQHPLVAMRLLLNGRPYLGLLGKKNLDRARENPLQASEKWSIELPPGAHRLQVAAETDKSYGLSAPLEVTYEPVDTQTPLPALHVLAVGVQKYPQPELRLPRAAQDAAELAAALEKHGQKLFREVKTQVVVDEQATRRGMLASLKTLKERMTARDTAVIYLRCQGAKDDNAFYLFPVDGEPNELPVSGLWEGQIRSALESLPGRVVVLLDIANSPLLPRGATPPGESLTDNLLRDLATEDYGVFGMACGDAPETAGPVAEGDHGAFARAFMAGLEGAADINKDGVVHWHELEEFAPRHVKEATQGRKRALGTRPRGEGPFAIARP